MSNTKSYYTEDDGIAEYWDARYVTWSDQLTELSKLNVFAGKDRWFEERFAHILPIPAERTGTVLDFGCGNAMYSPALLRRFRVYAGVDTSPTALDIARRYFGSQSGWTVFQSDPDCLLEIFKDGEFDCVMSITVLQHQPVALRLKAISEIKRVLKPGGKYVGLEMQGETQAFDMPPLPEEEWIAAWSPLLIVKDLPADRRDWWPDNIWIAE